MTSTNNKVDTDPAGAPDKGVGCGALVRRMDPDRFTVGERVQYVNHVTGHELGLLEVVGLEGDFVLCNRFFTRGKPFVFRSDGRAAWSSNLSIRHA